MSVPVVLLQLGSVSMSVAQVTTKGQTDVPVLLGLGYHQSPHGYVRAVVPGGLEGDTC